MHPVSALPPFPLLQCSNPFFPNQPLTQKVWPSLFASLPPMKRERVSPGTRCLMLLQLSKSMCHIQKRERPCLLKQWIITESLTQDYQDCIKPSSCITWVIWWGIHLHKIIVDLLSMGQNFTNTVPQIILLFPNFFHQCVFHIPLTFTPPLTPNITWQRHVLMLSLLLQCVTTAAQETCTPTGRWLVSSARTQYKCLQQSWDVHSVSMLHNTKEIDRNGWTYLHIIHLYLFSLNILIRSERSTGKYLIAGNYNKRSN